MQGDLFEKGSQRVKEDEDEGEGVQQQEGVKKRSRRGWAHMDDGRARKRQEFTFSGNWAVQKQFSRYFLFADPANHHSASQTLTTLTTFNGAAELQSCRAATLRRCNKICRCREEKAPASNM